MSSQNGNEWWASVWGWGRAKASTGPRVRDWPLALLAAVLLSVSARGQPGNREYPTLGAPSYDVREPWIAMGPNYGVMLYRSEGGASMEGVRYLTWDPLNTRWTEAADPIAGAGGAHDPCVAYDGRNDRFVAVARRGDGAHLITSRFRVDTFQFEPWVNQGPEGQMFGAYDKPWIVAGDDTFPSGQEFYITSLDEEGKGMRCFRSRDGGDTWLSEVIRLGGQVVLASLPQCTVWRDGPLYIAYFPKGEATEAADGAGTADYVVLPKIRFLMGTDGESNVSFVPLYASEGALLEVPVASTFVAHSLSGAGQLSGATVPWLLADPTDANRLFLVYNEHRGGSGYEQDVNVYLRRLSKNGAYWSVYPSIDLPGILVNQDANPDHDQFCPSVTVDTNGTIHALFFDDRRYAQHDKTTHPSFDIYWTYSANQGQEWHEERLDSDPDEPAINWNTQYKLDPREYNAIVCYGSRVWNAYAATFTGDTQANKSVLGSNRIP